MTSKDALGLLKLKVEAWTSARAAVMVWFAASWRSRRASAAHASYRFEDACTASSEAEQTCLTLPRERCSQWTLQDAGLQGCGQAWPRP